MMLLNPSTQKLPRRYAVDLCPSKIAPKIIP
jgi:hypothetical protein